MTMDMIQAIAPESQGHCSVSRAFAWHVRSPGFDSIVYYRYMLVYMHTINLVQRTAGLGVTILIWELVIQVRGIELTKYIFLNCPRYINSPEAHCGWELRPLF